MYNCLEVQQIMGVECAANGEARSGAWAGTGLSRVLIGL